MKTSVLNRMRQRCLLALALGALCAVPARAADDKSASGQSASGQSASAPPASAPAAHHASLDELADQLTWFYQVPSQEEFDAIQADADQLVDEIDAHGAGTNVLVAVAIARISEKNHWPLSKGAFGQRAGEILAGKTELARFVADDAQVTPTKLDIWWVSYFATGDERYLHHLFRYAGLDLPKGDTPAMLVIGAATWSAKSNCRQHPDVAAYAGKLADGKLADKPASAHQAEFLKACRALADDDSGTWIGKDGKPLPQTDALKSARGFGGQLMVTPDADWKEKWYTTPSAIPEFRTAKRVPYGKPLTVLTFYTNPRIDADGKFEVTCDVKLTRPDGSVPVDQKGIDCASGKLHGDPRNTRLASAVIGFVGEQGDPPGVWKVEITLTDKNRNVSLPLKTQFTLVKGKAKASAKAH